MRKIKIIPSVKSKPKIKIESKDCAYSEHLAAIDHDKIPYCQNPALGVGTPDCSEECYLKENVSSTNNSGISLNIDGEEYSLDKIIKILKKHKKEEDKKYSTCYRCGVKYLENKKFNMVNEKMEEDRELKPGTAIGYQISPIITGIQIQSTCGNGKKIKLCDNCIRKLLTILKENK